LGYCRLPLAGWGGDPTNKANGDGYVFKDIITFVNAFYYQNMKIRREFAGLRQDCIEGIKSEEGFHEKCSTLERGILA